MVDRGDGGGKNHTDYPAWMESKIRLLGVSLMGAYTLKSGKIHKTQNLYTSKLQISA